MQNTVITKRSFMFNIPIRLAPVTYTSVFKIALVYYRVRVIKGLKEQQCLCRSLNEIKRDVFTDESDFVGTIYPRTECVVPPAGS